MTKYLRFTLALLILSLFISCEKTKKISNESITSHKEETMLGLLFGGYRPIQNYVLSAPLSGIMLKNGKPLKDVKIVRKVTWFDGEETNYDKFKTNKNGEFSLPIFEKELKVRKLAQFVANTTLYVYSADNDENFFYFTSIFGGKVNPHDQVPINSLVCDFSREPASTGAVYSRCSWPDQDKIIDVFSIETNN